MGSSTQIADYVGQGTHAARPNPATLTADIGPGATAFYAETDTGNTFVLIAGAWVQVNGGGGGGGGPSYPYAPPAASAFPTQLNLASLASVSGFGLVADIAGIGGGDQICAALQPVPATPTWTVTQRISFPVTGNGSGLGAVVQDASGKLVTILYQGTNRLQYIYWNSPTSYSGSVYSNANLPRMEYFRFNWDGTNLNGSISYDGFLYLPLGATNFISAPTEIGFGGDANFGSGFTLGVGNLYIGP